MMSKMLSPAGYVSPWEGGGICPSKKSLFCLVVPIISVGHCHAFGFCHSSSLSPLTPIAGKNVIEDEWWHGADGGG
jgi:hypothetical protein